MKKLNITDIINHLENDAILHRIYSIWILELKCGKKIYDFRNGSPESAIVKINYEIISNNNNGYSLKIK